MRCSPRVLLSVGVCGMLAALSAPAAGTPDLDAIQRRIAKEPKYNAEQPLYGLYVFGPEAKTRVWAVLDKSKPDAEDYDVLYFDRNADGDLTGTDERIVGKSEGGEVVFDVGTFTDPATGDKHTNLSISRRTGEGEAVFLRMQWKGKQRVMGGYAEQPGPYTVFAKSPEKAPILRPGADGPFGFQRWMWDKLPIGGEDDVRVFLGHPGHGRNTFCALPEDFLPKKVPVLATLVYTDKDGKERRAQSELRERC
jgi:hypothetical protein